MVSVEGLVPTEVWDVVASYIRPQPFVYTRLSRISRSARVSFTSDTQWEYLVLGVDQRRYLRFVELMDNLSDRGKRELAETWFVAEFVVDDKAVYRRLSPGAIRAPFFKEILTQLQLSWAIIGQESWKVFCPQE